MSAAQPTATTRRLEAHLHRRARWRWPEIVFWVAVLAAIFVVPSRAALINEILIAGLFALSLDLILGLTGIVSLGQAAFFGLGAYAAAILASKGFADPTLGLLFGAAIAAVLGLVTAPLLLRGGDLTRLMVTLGVSLMFGELANRNGWLTGGADGLNFSVGKVLGLFPIGFTGQRNAALYSLAVLFILFAARADGLCSRRSGSRWRQSAKTGCARARSASQPPGASSRSIRFRRPTPARPALCLLRRRRSCRSTFSISTARPT